MKYDIYDGTTIRHTNVTRKFAADALDIDPCELEWAIEEYGRCDAELTAVPAGNPIPDPE